MFLRNWIAMMYEWCNTGTRFHLGSYKLNRDAECFMSQILFFSTLLIQLVVYWRTYMHNSMILKVKICHSIIIIKKAVFLKLLSTTSVPSSSVILGTPHFVIHLVSKLLFRNMSCFLFLKYDISIEIYTLKILSFKLKISSSF